MTARRWMVVFWMSIAVVVWLGMFDVLMSRGVKEYLYREAEHELGRGPAVTMPEIMGQTVSGAVVDCSLWALFVGGAGLATVYWSRERSTQSGRPA